MCIFVSKQYSIVLTTDHSVIMLCGWEGTHRSGITLVLTYMYSGIPTFQLKDVARDIITVNCGNEILRAGFATLDKSSVNLIAS